MVRIHDVPLIRVYGVSCKSQMKHPITSLWYVSITPRSYVVVTTCLYYGLYYVFKFLRRYINFLLKKWYPHNSLRPPPLPPPGKIAHWLGLAFQSRSGLLLGLGDNQTIAPKQNFPLVRVKVWLRVNFGVGGNFPRS